MLFRRQSDLIFGASIGLAVIAAVWLRWSGLDSQSLWADEGYTVWVSQFSAKEIWRIPDNTPPLYYIVLHYWSALFGNSELSVRALSAFFGTLSLLLFYLIARKILPSRMSVALAMMLYSVSFFQVWYAKEARCYALLVFLSLGSVYCALLCLEKASALRLLGLALVLSASLYTHNVAWFYLPGLAVLWFVYPSEMTIGARIRNAMIVAAIALFSYIPYLPSLGEQLRRVAVHGSFWVAKPRVRDLLGTLCILSGLDTGTLQDIFRDHFHSQRLFGFWTWAPAFLIILVLCVTGAMYAVRSADRRKSAALLVYSVLPILLVFLDSRLSTSIYINRLFLGDCALLPLVLCAPIAFQVGNRKRLFQFVALVVLVGTATSAFGYLRRERREDWRGATEYLLKLPERPRLVVVVRNYCQMLVHYYSTGLFKSYPPIEITGLETKFNPADPAYGERTIVDPIAMLSRAMDSGTYKEIDFALQPMAEPVKDITVYLAAHCASVEVIEFHWLEVRRCFVYPQGVKPR